MRTIDAGALLTAYENAMKELVQVTNVENISLEALSLLCGAKLIAEAQTVGEWISVKDRLPVETHSIFFSLYGKQKWSSAMWREQSDKVLVTVVFKDGTKLVTTGETHDGVWYTSISRTLEPEVTHWMPLPEPPKEENVNDAKPR